MAMQALPQVAADLQNVMDAAIVYASRAGEHKSVMTGAVEMHRIKKNVGDSWKGIHLAKIEAVTGGPRTRFTNAARASAENFECRLQYTVSVYSEADDQKTFLNTNFLRQWGTQQGEAVARQVDRVMLGIFRTFTKQEGTAGSDMIANWLEEAFFELEAAEDESSSPVQIVVPIAHMKSLVQERTATSHNSNLIPIAAAGLTQDAAKMLETKPMYTLHGTKLMPAKNSPKYGTNGYSGVFRKTAIKMVTAPVMQRETMRDPSVGGGARTTWLRKLWGYIVPPHGQRNWTSGVQASMPIGGR